MGHFQNVPKEPAEVPANGVCMTRVRLTPTARHAFPDIGPRLGTLLERTAGGTIAVMQWDGIDARTRISADSVEDAENPVAGRSGGRVLVCGPRDWTDWLAVYRTLTEEHAIDPIVCLIEGGARGVDRFAWQWATDRAIRTDRCAVDHVLDGSWPAAGPRRNGRMLREKRPDRWLAFVSNPPTKGTSDMIRQARKAGIPGREIRAESVEDATP